MSLSRAIALKNAEDALSFRPFIYRQKNVIRKTTKKKRGEEGKKLDIRHNKGGNFLLSTKIFGTCSSKTMSLVNSALQELQVPDNLPTTARISKGSHLFFQSFFHFLLWVRY